MDIRRSIRELIADLRHEKREKFGRHVPVGDLLTDRWEIARDYGFGEGTSCYDNVLILSDVKIGKHCWIGPNVILDGQGGSRSVTIAISAPKRRFTLTTVWRGVLAVVLLPSNRRALESAHVSTSGRNA
jgi:hypothetical protein